MKATALTDLDLIRTIGDDDLRTAFAREYSACGIAQYDQTPDAALAAEYERRYGVPLPADRSATWATYHTPAGWLWRVTLSTRPDTTRHDHYRHSAQAMTVSGTRPVRLARQAEESLASTIRRRGEHDSGIREESWELARVCGGGAQ